jgi:Type IV secretion-system coupling protein DNA-binding domain
MPLSNESSSYQGGESTTIDPLAPLEHLAQGLIGVAGQIVLGLLVGLVGARLMRHRHLHWSWAAVGLGLIVLARPLLAGSTTTLGVAVLSALLRSRRWHSEDLEAGADLAEIAMSRSHPRDALRLALAVVRSRLSRWSARRALGRWSSCPTPPVATLFGGRGGGRRGQGDELVLGGDRHGRPVSITLGGSGGGSHTLVLGATGSGKTVTQAAILTQAIARGMAAVVIDPKGDPALRKAAGGAARVAGRRFLEWSPTGPSVYNPYARGGETEIADKALAGERYTEPHYQRQAQRYLGHVVRALLDAGREVSLSSLVAMLDPARLEVLARELPPERARPVQDYLDSLTARQHSDLTGVRDRLAIMAESDVGPWLDPETPDAECFDLLEAIRTRAVVYFDLRADSRPLLSQMLGGAVVLDLQTAVATLQADPVGALVVIDEFSALAAEHVARLFGRARSAGVSLLLGTQELSDLRLPGREALQEQILGNLTSVIAHRQVVPESAELIARLAGTRGAWSTSWGNGDRVTRTRVREYVLSPDEIKRLTPGCAAVIRLAGRDRVAVARVLSPSVHL